ncbi:unnamed protein product [Adineta steineri]|uniref:F-box domain-containing protein n=1 Tax=Adineta steineri TaxID=433720 RepID=A0A814ERG7_9BILA|nr:unnamed protein product [Adineta steineri]
MESTSPFQTLPVELIYRMLDLLDAKDILFSFGHVCRRFYTIAPQATDIFNNGNYPEASSCASTYAPGMPTSVHAALTDIAFAGCGTLNQFVKMKAALVAKQWKTASDELKSSKWCTDVKSTRCGLDVACIASGK